MYCTVAVVVDTVHSYPSSAQKNWSIFIVLLHFWLLGLQHDHCCASDCSNKRCACSNKQRIYKRKKTRLFFFSRKCSNKRFAL